MISICEVCAEIEDWATIFNNTTLAQYAERVHNRWHYLEPVVALWGKEERKAQIDVCYADILRAIDLWIKAVDENGEA